MVNLRRWIYVLLITANTALVSIAAEPTQQFTTASLSNVSPTTPAHCERVDEAEMLLTTRELLQQNRERSLEVQSPGITPRLWVGRWAQLLQLDVF